MKSFLILLSLLIFLASRLSMSLVLDTITPDQPIKDGDILLSGQKTFALGFFRPGKSRFRYVGIWYYKVPKQTVVWVANRENPINDTSGILTIDSQGGLVIYGEKRNSPLWSANISVSSGKSSSAFIAKLSDFGNLVLLQNNSTVIWQSFDHPTNTYLPFLKLGLNRKSGLDRFITSWKSDDDPGTGSCMYRMDLTGYPQLVAYKGRTPFWRAGSWTGNRWSGVPEMLSMISRTMFNVSYVNNQDEISIMYGIVNNLNSFFSRLVIEESGTVRRSTWHDQRQEWVEFYYAPHEWCDKYGICGRNGNCDPSDPRRFECMCLPGFEPRSRGSWDSRDTSGGCVRKSGARVCGDGEGFVKVPRVKSPDTSNARVEWGLSLRECKEKCLKDCNCTAYTSADETRDGAGCLSWHGDLVDIRTFTNIGQDLYVRVDAITLAEYAKKSKTSLSKAGKLAIPLASVLVLFLMMFVLWWAKRKRKVKAQENKSLFSITTNPNFSKNPLENKLDDGRRGTELPFLELKTVAAATDNFSLQNKLGEGGFGPVYKGTIDGNQIAVKRLSKHSGQGIEEFKNEIILIAKLQHRNLVRLLGCCVQGEENMLIYEFVPNKSLDCFIFDEEKKKLLDWRKRFDIISGIARGILYLHQDSRLRIIHRDLKASNILLDVAMNPKIADFGMARIFSRDQIEANTNRVVGTYGYMSPEYAMEGRFSIKSDIYSFGILLLEIITGKKNTSYYHENPDRNLVGMVWELWREGKALEIVDSSLDETYVGEALRCITIGLLCVQEFPADRPTMSVVIFMLGNDSALPSPKQPAFVFKRSIYTSGDSSTNGGANSINDVTCSMIDAR